MLGGSMVDVRLRPIISGPSGAGGLPVPDTEAADIEGEIE
jgi:hypothetical protein